MAIDVWTIYLRHDVALDSWYELIDAEERTRANRFVFPEHRRRFILTHAALRSILARYVLRSAHDVEFELNAYGKPALKQALGASLSSTAVSFNLSHSHELALCAVASGGEIGVDVEWQRHLAQHDLAQRFFSPSESSALQQLEETRRHAGFFACWTRKEAYIKAKGLGLSLPLDRFIVETDPDKPAALQASDYAPEDVAGFRMWDVRVADGYRAALAYRGAAAGPPVVRAWEF